MNEEVEMKKTIRMLEHVGGCARRREGCRHEQEEDKKKMSQI